MSIRARKVGNVTISKARESTEPREKNYLFKAYVRLDEFEEIIHRVPFSLTTLLAQIGGIARSLHFILSGVVIFVSRTLFMNSILG